MSEAITVLCPSCKASLKLKSRSAVGKRVPCPKCKKPFVVQAPAADEVDEMSFLSARESDAAMPVSDDDDGAEAFEVFANGFEDLAFVLTFDEWAAGEVAIRR